MRDLNQAELMQVNGGFVQGINPAILAASSVISLFNGYSLGSNNNSPISDVVVGTATGLGIYAINTIIANSAGLVLSTLPYVGLSLMASAIVGYTFAPSKA